MTFFNLKIGFGYKGFGSFVIILVLVLGKGVYEVQGKALIRRRLLLKLFKWLRGHSRHIFWLFLAGLCLLSFWGWFLSCLFHLRLDLLLACSGLFFNLPLHSSYSLLASQQIIFPLFFRPLPVLNLPNPCLQLINIEQLLTNLLIVVPANELNILLPLILDDIPLVHGQELLFLWVALLAEQQLLDAIGDLMLLYE